MYYEVKCKDCAMKRDCGGCVDWLEKSNLTQNSSGCGYPTKKEINRDWYPLESMDNCKYPLGE